MSCEQVAQATWLFELKLFSRADESVHVCHKGYISLFPFFLEHIPVDSPHLKDVLDLIRDPQHLWSPYGLRSLSISDSYFGQGENYWKGPIWIQMNWLALKALSDRYMREPGPYQKEAREIYQDLRKNVVENIFKVGSIPFCC